jgi:hypothetical protein
MAAISDWISASVFSGATAGPAAAEDAAFSWFASVEEVLDLDFLLLTGAKIWTW